MTLEATSSLYIVETRIALGTNVASRRKVDTDAGIMGGNYYVHKPSTGSHWAKKRKN